MHQLKETDVQNSILEFLYYKKIVAWRNNNGAVFDPTNKKFRRKNKWETLYGSPVDILGILPDGKSLAIEVKKNERMRLSREQKVFIDHINENNGIGFKAYSLSCVKSHLADYI